MYLSILLLINNQNNFWFSSTDFKNALITRNYFRRLQSKIVTYWFPLSSTYILEGIVLPLQSGLGTKIKYEY